MLGWIPDAGIFGKGRGVAGKERPRLDGGSPRPRFCGLEQGKGVASFPLNREKIFAVEFPSTLCSALAVVYVRALDLAVKDALVVISSRAVDCYLTCLFAHAAAYYAIAGSGETALKAALIGR